MARGRGGGVHLFLSNARRGNRATRDARDRTNKSAAVRETYSRGLGGTFRSEIRPCPSGKTLARSVHGPDVVSTMTFRARVPPSYIQSFTVDAVRIQRVCSRNNTYRFRCTTGPLRVTARALCARRDRFSSHRRTRRPEIYSFSVCRARSGRETVTGSGIA